MVFHLINGEKIKKFFQSTFGFFIGSEYLPNIEAVNFIIQELANKCNHIKFIIAGGCCNSFFHIKSLIFYY